jgi:hypothetical protein
MKYYFVPFSRNVKTGPIPVTYSERDTCPPSCPHYRSDCYAEDFHTRMSWDKVPVRGGDLGDLCRSIAALGDGQMWRFNIAGDLPGVGESVDVDALKAIVTANVGRRGFTYTHKKSENAIDAALMATNAGFTVNLSADDAGEADALAETGLPVCAIVPRDCPELAYTPAGRTIVVCPAQTRDNITCMTCGLCARADRNVIIGFRAHGTRAAVTDAKARRVIPIAKAA